MVPWPYLTFYPFATFFDFFQDLGMVFRPRSQSLLAYHSLQLSSALSAENYLSLSHDAGATLVHAFVPNRLYCCCSVQIYVEIFPSYLFLLDLVKVPLGLEVRPVFQDHQALLVLQDFLDQEEILEFEELME